MNFSVLGFLCLNLKQPLSHIETVVVTFFELNQNTKPYMLFISITELFEKVPVFIEASIISFEG
ncbi:MAG: hypothetical protein PWQ67_2008 [Clostridia bacterium]|jgi:hypothetical protein|nr:hypothetical protein [Clostridia bacterium]MDN5323554.1 hypothetical protein [Clostridia bacterium]